MQGSRYWPFYAGPFVTFVDKIHASDMSRHMDLMCYRAVVCGLGIYVTAVFRINFMVLQPYLLVLLCTMSICGITPSCNSTAVPANPPRKLNDVVVTKAKRILRGRCKKAVHLRTRLGL